MLLSLVFAATPGFQADPPPSAADLWARGARIEAIERARAEAGPEPAAESWTRLVAWQLAVHRHQAALADALRCGAPCTAQRAEALYHLGDYAAAVELLDEADPTACLWKIDALEALSRFAESDAVLSRARERGKVAATDGRLLGAEGRAAARRDDFAAATRAFRAALAIDPHDGEALFGLGRALVRAGQENAALRDEGLRVMAEHRRIVPLLDAVDFARRGVDLAPAHAPNWTALGDAERALPRPERAESAYRRADELARGDEVVANALRWSRLLSEDRGDAQAAVDVLARAARRTNDARLHVRAGDVLVRAGRARDAIAAFEAARALRPNDAEIAKRLEAARAEASK